MTVRNEVTIEDQRWASAFDVQALADRVLGRAAREAGEPEDEDAEVSLLFTNDRRIAQLKAAWMGKEGPTNVLSFPADQGPEGDRLLGDIIVAYETIVHEAQSEGKTLEAHLSHMLVHGFLHLLGYDHIDDAEASAMEGLESRILVALGIADPWLSADGQGDEN